MKLFLKEKQEELIWALKYQGYSIGDIRQIFNFDHDTQVWRIIEKMPEDWKPKWVKRNDLLQ